MDLMKIENGSALFRKGEEWVSVAAIEKTDLLGLVRDAANDVDVSLGVADDIPTIRNPIEATIYSQLHLVLSDLVENRDVYLREIEEGFAKVEKQYGL